MNHLIIVTVAILSIVLVGLLVYIPVTIICDIIDLLDEKRKILEDIRKRGRHIKIK